MLSKQLMKKMADNRKKPPTRKLDPEISKKVLYRDLDCIICWDQVWDIHHAFFWSEKQYDDWRNWEDRLVGLCLNCHYDIHSLGNTDKRNKCKEYLKNYYVHNNPNQTFPSGQE